MMRANVAWVMALGTLLGLWPGRARALNFFELEVYPATTEGAGQHELESLTSFVANGRNAEEETHHLLRTSLEYNYGLTDKIDVAAYLDLEKPNGEDLEYAGSRFRARGALWDKGRFPLDVGCRRISRSSGRLGRNRYRHYCWLDLRYHDDGWL